MGSFLLVGLEAIIRILTLALRKYPTPKQVALLTAASIHYHIALLSRIKTNFQSIHITRGKEGRNEKEE